MPFFEDIQWKLEQRKREVVYTTITVAAVVAYTVAKAFNSLTKL